MLYFIQLVEPILFKVDFYFYQSKNLATLCQNTPEFREGYQSTAFDEYNTIMTIKYSEKGCKVVKNDKRSAITCHLKT